jgi:hypothetical protein
MNTPNVSPSLRFGVIFCLFLSLLPGCKGSLLSFSGQAGTEGVSGPSLTSLTGTAFDGPVTSGSVAISQYQSDGSLLPLGTVTTDHNGNFSATTLIDTGGGPLLFTLTGGQTIDLASGATVSFTTGESLMSILPAGDVVRATAVLTPFSTLEATEVQTLVAQGSSPSQALTQARSDWNQFLGFDPAEIPPVDLSTTPASADSSGIYGLLLAGLSELTYHIGQTQSMAPGAANPMGLLTLLDQDIGDGLLNGLTTGNPTPLAYYGYSLSAETLRKDLTAEALIFLWTGQNQSGLTPALTDGILNGIALNTGPLFPPSPTPVVPDPGSPSVTLTNPVSGLFYNGTLVVQASATDSLGIAQMVLTGQNIVIPGGSLSGNPIISSIDTTQSPSGPASLTATATDYAGNTRSQTVDFTIDNTPPTLSGLSPPSGAVVAPGCPGNTVSVSVTGTITDTLSGPSGVQVQETAPVNTPVPVSYTAQSPTSGAFSFIFTVPSNGCTANPVSFTVTGYDNLQNSTVLPYTLSVTN